MLCYKLKVTCVTHLIKYNLFKTGYAVTRGNGFKLAIVQSKHQ